MLSPIEQSIKHKIEAIGKPLKDWDISINYGIKTGYNDAFIVTTEKKNEILEACQSEEERSRTVEIFRPILRGRDIKRYSYEWADLWLIATFPSRHYDVEQYPALKQYLLSFGMERLEQSGKEYIVDGHRIKARKKTSNKWFETQDSISYWDDFQKHKIIWKRIGSKIRFSYDCKGVLGLDSTCFATGSHIPYICCVLNSSMGHYLLQDAPRTGTGDLLISVQAIEPVKIPPVPADEETFETLVNEATAGHVSEIEETIERLVFDLYGLNEDEREYIINNYR